jgi:hypothetical protein
VSNVNLEAREAAAEIAQHIKPREVDTGWLQEKIMKALIELQMTVSVDDDDD